MSKHIPPTLDQKSFHCPQCGVLAEQVWSSDIRCHYPQLMANGQTQQTLYQLPNTRTAKCKHCGQVSFWLNEKMIYPLTGNVEMANEDLPDDIKNDYNEAKNIVNLSPKGAVALLRLAVQKLCKHLGESGDNINLDIGNLVKKGLPVKLQQALDSVRVVGNNAVHPGQIDLKDDVETANKLFAFINIICDNQISQPKQINAFYQEVIPDNLKQAIEKRDGH